MYVCLKQQPIDKYNFNRNNKLKIQLSTIMRSVQLDMLTQQVQQLWWLIFVLIKLSITIFLGYSASIRIIEQYVFGRVLDRGTLGQ